MLDVAWVVARAVDIFVTEIRLSRLCFGICRHACEHMVDIASAELIQPETIDPSPSFVRCSLERHFIGRELSIENHDQFLQRILSDIAAQ